MTRSARGGSTPRARSRKAIPDASAAVPRRGGRPSRQQAARLGERIVDAATHLFLTQGYGATSIEAVARRARISKRTFYHRFDDKPALFVAVVHRIIDRLRSPADVERLVGDLQEVLQRLARFILRAALLPEALALNRMLVAESARFPKLAAVATERGVIDEGIRFIAGILEREIRAGKLALDNPAFAAQQLLYMIIALPQRRAMGFGAPMTPAELDAWARDVVNLFLNGCRGRARVS